MTGSVLTPVEEVRRILAEAGYPDAQVTDEGEGRIAIVITSDDDELVPERVAWAALRSVGPLAVGCFDCWRAGRPDCTHG